MRRRSDHILNSFMACQLPRQAMPSQTNPNYLLFIIYYLILFMSSKYWRERVLETREGRGAHVNEESDDRR